MPTTFDFYVEGGISGPIIGLQVHGAGDITDIPMTVDTARVIGAMLLSHVAALGKVSS